MFAHNLQEMNKSTQQLDLSTYFFRLSSLISIVTSEMGILTKCIPTIKDRM